MAEGNKLSVLGELGKPTNLPNASTRRGNRTGQNDVTIEAYHHSGDMQPLIAAAHHNRTKSPLCSLPDAILVRLMQLSDNVTVECLRRCSRLFLRLYPSACFSAEDFSMLKTEEYPWPTSPLRWLPEDKEAFLALIARDVYCQDCLAARNSRDSQKRVASLTKTYMHCAGCEADHPACLFSAKERERDQSRRVCIGREGHLRLCQHTIVTWPYILSMATQKGKSYNNLIQCKWSKHLGICTHHRSFFMFPKRVSDLDHAKCCPSYPSLSCGVAKNPPFDKADFMVILTWSTHLPLVSQPDGTLRAEILERGLQKLYQRQGRIICPPLMPGPVIGSRIGDPCRCNCVEYAGRRMITWERPPSEWRKKKTCLTEPAQGITRVRMGSHHAKVIGDVIKTSDYWCYSHRLKRHTPEEHFLHMADIIRAPRDKSCMVVTYQSQIGLMLEEDGRLQRMNNGWYQALEPSSYNLIKDTDGFGVYWCKAEGCRNFYRYGRSRLHWLLQPSDYVKPCPR